MIEVTSLNQSKRFQRKLLTQLIRFVDSSAFRLFQSCLQDTVSATTGLTCYFYEINWNKQKKYDVYK